jgi:hypothetical protein
MMSRLSAPTLILLGLVLAAAGCNDPVHDNDVASLGPEDPNVPPGPLHRPGQPCMWCHDGTGPASLAFATAGTVFQDMTDSTPLVAARVQMTDYDNAHVVMPETNCAGNFFVEAADWDLVFPVRVQVNYGATSALMISHWARSGVGCANCHVSTTVAMKLGLNVDPQASTSQVYLSAPIPCMLPTDCPSGFTCSGGMCQYPPSGCSQ